MFHFAGRGGYNSREATVQERRLLAPTTFSLSSNVSFHLHKLEIRHEKVFVKH